MARTSKLFKFDLGKTTKAEFDEFAKRKVEENSNKKGVFLRSARLIPTTKFGDETTLTSIFLSGLKYVDEFRDMFFSEAKIKKGSEIYAYTEVPFTDYKDCRFDGMLLSVTGGKIKDVAIFEVKKGNNEIDSSQIERYCETAKELRIPKVITISNQFVSLPTQTPISIKTPSCVSMYHFSWSYILTMMNILIVDNDTNIEDKDQVNIMKEMISYFSEDKAGISGFTQMKNGWKETVERINRPDSISDKYLEEAVSSWQQEERDMALRLSQSLGLFVKSGDRKYRNDLNSRIADEKQKIVEKQMLSSTLKVEAAVSDIGVDAFLRDRKIEMSVTVKVPQDTPDRNVTFKGQMGFIRQQLKSSAKKSEKDEKDLFSEISKDLFLDINIKNLKGLRRVKYQEGEMESIINEYNNTKEIKEINVVYSLFFGKDFTSPRKFITLIEQMLEDFYVGIVQHLKNWERPAPKIKESGESTNG